MFVHFLLVAHLDARFEQARIGRERALHDVALHFEDRRDVGAGYARRLFERLHDNLRQFGIKALQKGAHLSETFDSACCAL